MIKGLGTDIVEIARIRRMIERHGDSFLQRCYTASEIEWAMTYRDSAVRFAGRWAAKEAVVKALGTGFIRGFTFHDVEVLPLHTGQPQVRLSGAAEERAAELEIQSMMITISHCREHATATAIGV